VALHGRSFQLRARRARKSASTVGKSTDAIKSVPITPVWICQALDSSHQAYVPELGRVVRQGPSAELIHDQGIIASYLCG
jgi:ABC-type branched-subunit amino acid transport system ATPase component